MSDSPAVILYDANSVAMAVQDGVAIPANTAALLIAGKEGSNSRFLRVAADGTVRIDPVGTTTQPISAAALPLPAGASTEATLALIKAKTDNLDVLLSTRAVTGLTDAQLRAAAVPISAASLPLPAGAATAAGQGVIVGHIDGLEALLTTLNAVDFATQPTLAAISTILTAIRDTAGIKKITDQLPAGTNNIGDVDVATNPQSIAAAKLVAAQFHQAAVAATTYYLFIDLDNTGGDYKHTGSTSIKIQGIAGSIIKSSIGAAWTSITGIVLRIDGTDSDIAWLDSAALYALDTSKDERDKFVGLSSAFDLEVAGGVLTKAATGYVETGLTAVNTATTLLNVVGTLRAPAVGDMILKVEKISGGGTCEANYNARYYVD